MLFPMDDDYGRRLSEQLVIEVKAAMARAGISSSRALGRAIGQNSQYMSNRLDGGNPRTGERVPLNVHDLADIGQALGLEPHVLIERAERELERTDRSLKVTYVRPDLIDIGYSDHAEHFGLVASPRNPRAEQEQREG